MFTGIITKLGRVIEIEDGAGSRKIVVDAGYHDLVLGESVAVNGVCLTVTDTMPAGCATFFTSTETLRRTALGSLKEGSRVNLERALKAEDRLSGHLVQGHVDGLAEIASIKPENGCYLLKLRLPEALMAYCVEKGSIAVDGVSLTINGLKDEWMDITLIPHTWTHTRFSSMSAGDPVNIEVDVLAKYVEKLCKPYLKLSAP